MPSASIKVIAGLYTSPNPFSRVPEGALTIADEVIVRGAGVLEPRRGLPPSAQSFTADRCFPLPLTRKAITTARTATAPSVYDPDADTITVLSRSGGNQPLSYPYQSDARVSLWGATALSLCYLAGQQGLACTDGSTWRAAGLSRPNINNIQLDTNVLDGPLNFATGQRRTYCVTLAWYDPSGNFHESEPSDSQWQENTGAAATPYLNINYPPMTPPGAFFRIWRTPETAAGTLAGTEFYLVREFIQSSQTIGADGYVTLGAANIYDISTDSLLNVPLYTNPQTGDGQGILGANSRPPAAAATAWFKQREYFGRTTFAQQIVVQIIGTGVGGTLVGDSLTIGGYLFTGVTTALTLYGDPGYASTNAFGASFYVFTGGTVSQNIEGTARSLTAAINGFMSTYVMANNSQPPQRQLIAYYASSGVNDFGRIVIQRPIPTPSGDDPGIAFSVVTTSAGVRFPNGSINSTDNYAAGGLSWSKYNQPEAVPVINYTVVGDPGKAILGFAVLRDALLIFKEQEGVFILYDQGGPQPTIQILDPTVVCIAPQSIAVLNNAAFCLTARGPMQITEQSSTPVGEPIRVELQRLAFQNTNFGATAFGCSYEAERLYILGMPIGASETTCSQQFVLNIQNGTWQRWLKAGATSAMMFPVQQKLLMTYSAPLPLNNVVTGISANGVYSEAKGGVVSTDYYDLAGGLPAATYAALTLATVAPGTPPAVIAAATLTYVNDMHEQVFEGDLLLFAYVDGSDGLNHAQWARVTGVVKTVVSIDTASITTADLTVLMSKAPTYYRAIRSHWRFAPITLGEPTFEKQWNATEHHFDYFDGDWLDFQIDTEKSGAPTGFSQLAADAKIINTSGACGATQWLRNCRGVVMRCDPSWQKNEARGARLGLEFAFNQARARFQLVASSAHAHEWKEKATR